MDNDRIGQAMARIEAALARIEAARPTDSAADPAVAGGAPAGTARVIALVNTHEKLREEVAETMRDLDGLIAQLEA